MWKSKIPLKIKLWLWLIWHDAIATKDNLLKRIGLVIPSANFVPQMNLFCICSLLAMQLNIVGSWWGWLWVPPPVLDLLLSSSGGCHSFPMRAAMSRSPPWQPFAGDLENA
jgi:hypothetical protein